MMFLMTLFQQYLASRWFAQQAEVSGLQKAFDSLNIAINLIGDGFRAVGVVTNLCRYFYRLAGFGTKLKRHLHGVMLKKKLLLI